MIWLMVFSTAFAKRIAFEEQLSGAIENVALSPDDSLVAFGGADTVSLFNLTQWNIETISPCSSGASQGLVFTSDSDLLIGCSDGSISYYNTGDGVLTQEKLTLDADAILALTIDDETLYAVAENPSGGQPRVHAVTLSSYEEAAGGYPSTLSVSGLKDVEVVGNYLIISHGGSSVSKVDLASGSPTRDENGPTNVEHLDVLDDPTASNAIIAGGSGGLIRFLFSSNDTQYALGESYVTDATAVALYNDAIWIADGMRLHSYAYSSNGATVGTEMLEEVTWNSTESITEMVFAGDYLIYGASGGSYGVVTDRPWVVIDAVSNTTAVDGETVSLSFTSDTAGDYSVRIGATENGTGTAIATGEITEGGSETIQLTVDDNFVEGDNLIRVEVSSSITGHDATVISIDNPPGAIVLSDTNLGSGNGKLSLSFEPLSDPDIVEYRVYVSTDIFDSADYPTGGPEFEAIALADRSIPHNENVTASLTLSPLTNDIRYYIGVRAIDKSGMEGPMSTIISGVPKLTKSASTLSNETGGYCGLSAPLSLSLAFFGVVFAALRRRSALLVAPFALFPLQANALDSFGVSSKNEVNNAIEVQYGPLSFDSESLNLVFGESGNNALFLNAGQTYWGVLELSAGAGFIQEMGFLLTEENTASTDHDMLTIFPFSLSTTLRLNYWDEQLIVPTASVGLDYWVWRENWVESGVAVDQSGGKLGWNYSFGVDILLDFFDENGSANMDVFYGISDTYFVIEHRRQQIGQWAENPGLLFHGSATTFGFRFQR